MILFSFLPSEEWPWKSFSIRTATLFEAVQGHVYYQAGCILPEHIRNVDVVEATVFQDCLPEGKGQGAVTHPVWVDNTTEQRQLQQDAIVSACNYQAVAIRCQIWRLAMGVL